MSWQNALTSPADAVKNRKTAVDWKRWGQSDHGEMRYSWCGGVDLASGYSNNVGRLSKLFGGWLKKRKEQNSQDL